MRGTEIRQAALWAALLIALLPLLGWLPPQSPVFDSVRLAAQSQCRLVSSRQVSSNTVGGSRIVYAGAPVVECDRGERFQADSAVIFRGSRYSQFFGNVLFQDRENRLTSGRATYFEDQERLLSWEDPVLVNRGEGSEIRGDTLELLRAGERRVRDRITVWGDRPHATLRPAGADGKPDLDAAPYDVDADRIYLEGNDYFRATGDVRILRDSLDARGETAEYDQAVGRLDLLGSARIVGSAYDLSGDAVLMTLEEGEARRVVARDSARLVGEEFEASGREIRIFLGDRGGVERLVVRTRTGDPAPDPAPAAPSDSAEVDASEATRSRRAVTPPEDRQQDGRSAPTVLGRDRGGAPSGSAPGPDGREPEEVRAVILAESIDLSGDSIEVMAPGERLERAVAVGRARGVASRDSLATPQDTLIPRDDWIVGDTIVALFVADTLPAAVREEGDALSGPRADTVRTRYRLDRLDALGAARSLYRMEPEDSLTAAAGRLALHYVEGSTIRIFMTEGEIERMEVEGQTHGYHLEPARVRPDSAAVVESSAVEGADPEVDPVRGDDTARSEGGADETEDEGGGGRR